MREAKECCGLFGIFNNPNAVQLAYHGLYAQQHRGEESAGIAAVQNDRIVFHKAISAGCLTGQSSPYFRTQYRVLFK